MSVLRRLGVGVVFATALLLPGFIGVWGGLGPREVLAMASFGLGHSLDLVGWVLLPQLLLAVVVGALFLQRVACRGAGTPLSPAPAWLDAAIESALLLGMLGTITGMVAGFVEMGPGELEAGSLIHSLGTALRSSSLGFGVALVGVWTRVGGAVPESSDR